MSPPTSASTEGDKSKPGANQPLQHRRINTLGLTRAELDAIYKMLEQPQAAGAAPRRNSARLEYHDESLPIDIVQPGGGQTHVLVACRNLSRNGLGFLHSSYLHVGTQVVVHLTNAANMPVRLRGSIVRCRHVTRHIHDVGVKFSTPLNVRDFVHLDSLSQTFSCENVDPSKLKGTLLIVAEYKIELACMQSMLRDTALEFLGAATIKDGLEQAVKGVDMVMCDHQLPDGTGIEFMRKIRDAGVGCPVVIMSADHTPEVRTTIRNASASGFLAKPLDRDTLLRAMAEFLLLSNEREGGQLQTYSTLPANSPLGDLANDFVNDLHTSAVTLDEAAKKGNLEDVRKICLRIAGSAPALGFEMISKAAIHVNRGLTETMSVEESMGRINTLIIACRSVRKRTAA